MTNKDLSDYITTTRNAGFGDEDIKQKLHSSGWSESDVAAAFVTTVPQKNSSATRYLLYTLLLNVVGFGTCTTGFMAGRGFSALTPLIILAALVYLLAGFFAIRCLIAVYQDTTHGIIYKIAVVLLALALGGWAGIWGFVGLSSLGNL